MKIPIQNSEAVDALKRELASLITPEMIATMVSMLNRKIKYGKKSEKKEAAKLLKQYYEIMEQRMIKHRMNNPKPGQFIAGMFDSIN